MSEEILQKYEKKKKKKLLLQVLITIVVIALPAIFMTHSILSTETIDCEVCIQYKGMNKCRMASGPTKSECQRTATDNACAFISSGMTDSIQCSNQKPIKLEFY